MDFKTRFNLNSLDKTTSTSRLYSKYKSDVPVRQVTIVHHSKVQTANTFRLQALLDGAITDKVTKELQRVCVWYSTGRTQMFADDI